MRNLAFYSSEIWNIGDPKNKDWRPLKVLLLKDDEDYMGQQGLERRSLRLVGRKKL